jgi:hypothetical protein
MAWDAGNVDANWGSFKANSYLPFQSTVTAEPAFDGQKLYVAIDPIIDSGDNVLFPTTIVVADLKDTTSTGVPLTTSLSSPFTLTGYAQYTSLAVDEQMLYAAHTNPLAIELFNVSPHTPSKDSYGVTLTNPTVVGGSAASLAEVHDMTASGSTLFFVGSAAAYTAPYVLYYVPLGSGRTIGTATPTIYQLYSSTVPLGSPIIVGDTLYLRQNSGLLTWDLRPLWGSNNPYATRTPLMPVPAGSQGSGGVIYQYPDAKLIIDGPFAYELGADYRVFDLR